MYPEKSHLEGLNKFEEQLVTQHGKTKDEAKRIVNQSRYLHSLSFESQTVETKVKTMRTKAYT